MRRQKRIFVSWFKTYFDMQKQFIWTRFRISWSWYKTFWTANFDFKYQYRSTSRRLNNVFMTWIIMQKYDTKSSNVDFIKRRKKRTRLTNESIIIISKSQVSIDEKKNRDFFKIMTNFMNLFNSFDQIKYSFVYHDQNSFKEQKKFDFDRIFAIKIISSSFKTFFQITSKNEFDSEKNKYKKFFKQKNHVYMIKNDEKKVDYYKFSNDEKTNDNHDSKQNLNANYDDENSFASSDQKKIFVKMSDSILTKFMRICKKCRFHFFFNNRLHVYIQNQYFDQFLIKTAAYNSFAKKIEKSHSQNQRFFVIISAIDSSQNLKTEFEFRDYQYATAQFRFSKFDTEQSDCLNTNVELIIIDKKIFLVSQKNSLKS